MHIGPSGLTGFARHTTLPLLLLSLGQSLLHLETRTETPYWEEGFGQ